MLHEELIVNRILPVVVIEDADLASPLAEAVSAGGLRCIEITMRTDVALAAMQLMTQTSDLLIGAGTVLNREQAQAAVDHGARFIVSPGMSMGLVDWCQARNIPIFPGCATATELQMALEAGLDTVKFFPAEQLGGTAMLKTLGGVFRSMRFMPTGGINGDNVEAYLALPQVVACGGSWMVKPEWLQARRFETIQAEIAATLSKLQNGKFCADG